MSLIISRNILKQKFCNFQSHPSHLKYRIIFESKVPSRDNFSGKETVLGKESRNDNSPINMKNTLYHSQLVQQTLEELLYPAALFSSSNISSTDDNGFYFMNLSFCQFIDSTKVTIILTDTSAINDSSLSG